MKISRNQIGHYVMSSSISYDPISRVRLTLLLFQTLDNPSPCLWYTWFLKSVTVISLFYCVIICGEQNKHTTRKCVHILVYLINFYIIELHSRGWIVLGRPWCYGSTTNTTWLILLRFSSILMTSLSLTYFYLYLNF